MISRADKIGCGKVDDDTVTLNGVKGVFTCVDEGHVVEHILSILNNPRRYQIYWRNIRDKLRRTLPKTRCQ